MDFEPDWPLRWVRENGSRLRGLRIDRRISRRQLADAAGVNVSQVCRAEEGRDVRLSTLLKLCDGLGYRLEFDLLELSEEAGALLSEESWRREERRDAGLLTGKRWR